LIALTVLPGLLRQICELAAQRLQLRDELGVRIRRAALSRHGFLVRKCLGLFGAALQIAERRRRDGIRGRYLWGSAAQDGVRAVTEPRTGLNGL